MILGVAGKRIASKLSEKKTDSSTSTKKKKLQAQNF